MNEKKLFSIFILISFLFVLLPLIVLAGDPVECARVCLEMYPSGAGTTGYDNCLARCTASPIGTKADITLLIGRIADWLTGIAATIGVIMIIIGGIMYMTAGGNEDRAAKAKKTLLYGIIGIFIALMAWGIGVFITNLLGGY